MSDKGKVFVEIYKATLEFLGKLAVPLMLLILGLIYKGDIAVMLDGLKLTKIETPVISAQFEEIIENLASAEPNSEQEAKALRMIEIQEAFINAEIDTGLRKHIPVEAVVVPVDSKTSVRSPDPSWTPILGNRWVKPTDLFGRTYFLSVDDEFYIWPVTLDVENERAMFAINTSAKARSAGKPVTENIWVNVGNAYVFTFKRSKYRLNLLSIKTAGKIPSNAAYISVDREAR